MPEMKPASKEEIQQQEAIVLEATRKLYQMLALQWQCVCGAGGLGVLRFEHCSDAIKHRELESALEKSSEMDWIEATGELIEQGQVEIAQREEIKQLESELQAERALRVQVEGERDRLKQQLDIAVPVITQIASGLPVPVNTSFVAWAIAVSLDAKAEIDSLNSRKE